ncbi:unnamed protein product [Camellia sinensis]
MGDKKKFIKRKQSATFQLLVRDSSDPNYTDGTSGDRIFVRVDNNSYSPYTFFEGDEDGQFADNDPNSVFADAPDDCDDEDDGGDLPKQIRAPPQSAAAVLPDNVRREILELGFPDDGSKLDQLPLDVKAYDAWRVEIPGVNDDLNEKSIYNVASRTVGVRIQKADFLNLVENSAVNRKGVDVVDFVDAEVRNLLPNAGSTAEKPRALHLLDELFDMSRQQFLLSQTFFEGDEDGQFADNDPNSMFADAPDDCDDEDDGFPDDGYNYLIHLRKIKNTGGGSAYYHNSKAKLDQLPLDVKK